LYKKLYRFKAFNREVTEFCWNDLKAISDKSTFFVEKGNLFLLENCAKRLAQLDINTCIGKIPFEIKKNRLCDKKKLFCRLTI
jgi:hypothetical protein